MNTPLNTIAKKELLSCFELLWEFCFNYKFAFTRRKLHVQIYDKRRAKKTRIEEKCWRKFCVFDKANRFLYGWRALPTLIHAHSSDQWSMNERTSCEQLNSSTDIARLSLVFCFDRSYSHVNSSGEIHIWPTHTQPHAELSFDFVYSFPLSVPLTTPLTLLWLCQMRSLENYLKKKKRMD